MKLKNVIGTAAVLSAFIVSTTAVAGTCKLTITRTACSKEKEKAMLKPYDGKNPTEETHQLGSEKECIAKAEELVKIVRKGTITAKSVAFSFDGKDLGKKDDKADCK